MTGTTVRQNQQAIKMLTHITYMGSKSLSISAHLSSSASVLNIG